jgi:hypothetical protein
MGNITFFSGIVAALRDARKTTNRNQDTGEKIPNTHHGSWLGAIGYLVLLNQIGNCFKPKNIAGVRENSIVKALKYFTNLNDNEINAIYALRCSFAHDYSLTNINRNPLRQHRFNVCVGDNFVVLLAKNPWNGDMQNKDRNNITTISLEGLADLIESIFAKLIELLNRDELECILPGGPLELLNRYSFYSKP